MYEATPPSPPPRGGGGGEGGEGGDEGGELPPVPILKKDASAEISETHIHTSWGERRLCFFEEPTTGRIYTDNWGSYLEDVAQLNQEEFVICDAVGNATRYRRSFISVI